MTLSNTYKEYIVERLMLDYLKDSKIPTTDQIEEDLHEYMKTHPDLSLPLSVYKDFTVERGSSSSADKIQEIANVASQDIGVITQEIYNITRKSSVFYDRWSAEAKRLSARAKGLEHKIDSLLLLNQDTSGFFSYVGDIFVDMNKIDIKETSAKVNIHENTVTLNTARSMKTDASRGAQIDLTKLNDSNVSFSILSKRPGTVYETLSDYNSLCKIFKTDNSTWEGRVSSGSSGDMVVELKVNLDETFDLTKVSFRFLAPVGKSNSTASLQYSTDGYTWFLVNSSAATKPLSKNMAWTFPKTSIRWLKFIIRKAAPDEGNDYIFSASHIKLFGDVFDKKEPNLLVSKPLQVKDYQDKLVRFSLVSLDVCADNPKGTDIQYYISVGKENNTSWTSWIPIAPSDKEGVSYPKVVNVGGVNWKDNTTEVTKFDSSLLCTQLTRTFDEDIYSYKFMNNSFGVINTIIPVSNIEDADPVGNSVVVWRNICSKDNYPDTKLVRGRQRGWGYDGGQYSCYFEIMNSDGAIFNFGDKICIIDGQKVSGVVTINKGIHKFKTDAVNWFDIADNINNSSEVLSNETILEKVDPLYPYNHKLIIEGFPYSNDFRGTKVYSGTDISAEFYAIKRSIFELERNSIDYSSFSVKNIGQGNTSALAVLSNFEVSNSDHVNELFIVKWRSGEDNNELYTSLKLKAELRTNDNSLTPVLQSYRLKLGL